MSKVYRLILLIIVPAVLLGCKNDALEPLNSGDTILAFGDSLTLGKGTTPELAYPAILQKLSNFTVVNAGISGETTDEGLLRFPKELATHNPALVILFEGGNDILRNYPKAQTQSNLAEMINLAKAHGSQVVLVGVPEKSLFSSIAPFYKDLAEQNDVPLEEKIVANLLRKPAMKSDSVHFNQHGYQAIAEAIHELLVNNGAL